MDGAASDDEEISALGASPARPRAGGSAASSPTLSLPESFSNLGGEPAPLARQLESELAATHEKARAGAFELRWSVWISRHVELTGLSHMKC